MTTSLATRRPVTSAPDTTRRLPRRGGAATVRALSVVAVVALWQLASYVGLLPERILPAPQLVAEAALEVIRSGELGSALAVSSLRVVEGLALGGVTGVLLGALVGGSRLADLLLDPSLQAIRALPHLGLVPLFILWFGIGETPKVLLIALGVMFPLYLNTASALRQVDPELVEMARVFGFPRWRIVREVILPSITPQVLVGLRQALALGWLSLVVAEQVNATNGLGFLINNARDFLRTDVVIVGLVVYALLGLVTDSLVRLLERRALAHRA